MNFNHAKRSSLPPLVTHRLWCGYLTPLVKSIMRLKKARPGGTTQQAKFNKLISDWSWLKVVFLQLIISFIFPLIFMIFLCGSLVAISCESKVIPIKTIQVVGWTVFSSCIGTPNSEHKSTSDYKAFLQSSDHVSPSKSSIIWTICPSLIFWVKLQWMAELNASKVAQLQPIGSVLSK